jgi:hypothetical protein
VRYHCHICCCMLVVITACKQVRQHAKARCERLEAGSTQL